MSAIRWEDPFYVNLTTGEVSEQFQLGDRWPFLSTGLTADLLILHPSAGVAHQAQR